MLRSVFCSSREEPPGEIPAPIADFLDGEDLESKVTLALRLSTVDADGWPHASLLSGGDMLALPGGRIRLAIHPGSSTCGNLARDGRLTLTMPVGRGLCELWMEATKLGEGTDEVPLAFFEARCVGRLQPGAGGGYSGDPTHIAPIRRPPGISRSPT